MSMTCREAQEEFGALIDGEIDDARRNEVNDHLDSCADCLKEFGESVHLMALCRFREENAILDSDAALESVWRMLQVQQRQRRFNVRGLFVPLALAAGMAIVFGGFLLFQFFPSEKRFEVANVSPNAPPVSPVPEVPTPVPPEAPGGTTPSSTAPASVPLPENIVSPGASPDNLQAQPVVTPKLEAPLAATEERVTPPQNVLHETSVPPKPEPETTAKPTVKESKQKPPRTGKSESERRANLSSAGHGPSPETSPPPPKPLPANTEGKVPEKPPEPIQQPTVEPEKKIVLAEKEPPAIPPVESAPPDKDHNVNKAGAALGPLMSGRPGKRRPFVVGSIGMATGNPEKAVKTPAETKMVGETKFALEGGAWKQEGYRNQKTTPVRKGSKKYEHLLADYPDLAKISELGDEVIFSCKDKWYRLTPKKD